MRLIDSVKLSSSAIFRQKLRASLTILGISIGIASVVLLTSIGEGIHRFVLAEFTQFGTTIIGITPGKETTLGISAGVFANERPLSIADSIALKRIPDTVAIVPSVMGNAEMKANNRTRRATVYGVGPQMPLAFQFNVGSGHFLPDEDITASRALAVLGHKLKKELFADSNPLGKKIRIGGDSYRIIGTMEPKGQILGFDLDDTVYIPVSRALSMFNRESLMEIDLMYEQGSNEKHIVDAIKKLLITRHGREDFTITTQQQMLDVMGNVLNILTFAVAALGGISLLVGGVGILTIMLIAIQERTSEIGLLRALGAQQKQILWLFLGEAVVLAGIGGIIGLAIGYIGAQALHIIVPALPVHTPFVYMLLAEAIAIIIGLLAGVLPALKAARMQPVEALRAE
ncbi:MAG: FtsX-like permease family protein [Gammaproteobacteria bacterium]|nr:FtsX-like permease family protein [Gammaproteobacteria bacterium]